MKLFGALIVLPAGLFYVAWPAYSGYRIKTALESGDVTGLERGIDFPAVRGSLRPVVTEKVELSLKTIARGTPGSDFMIESLRAETLPRLVDAALDTLLTPQALIRLHADGKTIKDAIAGLARDKPDLAGQLGGLIGDIIGRSGATTTPPDGGVAVAALPGTKRLGFGNIKSVAFDGPFTISLGVARDATSVAADVIATMTFTGADWKVTGLVPTL